jgi:hypothetical protein
MSTPNINSAKKLEDLYRNGYLLIRDFAPPKIIDTARAIKHKLRYERTHDIVARPHLGAVLGVEESQLFRPFILFQRQYDLLAELGFRDPRFFAGFLITKPPLSKRLHWHQDWWGWSDPTSYKQMPPLLYFMYYLITTCKDNGCLRVIPGSHVAPNVLHELLRGRETHPSQILADDDTALSDRPDEVDVPVEAGDLILRDGRLLHASHANNSNQERDLLLLAFTPNWDGLTENMRCAFDRKRQRIEKKWSSVAADAVLKRATYYSGDIAPISLDRNPSFKAPWH